MLQFFRALYFGFLLGGPVILLVSAWLDEWSDPFLTWVMVLILVICAAVVVVCTHQEIKVIEKKIERLKMLR